MQMELQNLADANEALQISLKNEKSKNRSLTNTINAYSRHNKGNDDKE
jgi:hypothetical protein